MDDDDNGVVVDVLFDVVVLDGEKFDFGVRRTLLVLFSTTFVDGKTL